MCDSKKPYFVLYMGNGSNKYADRYPKPLYWMDESHRVEDWRKFEYRLHIDFTFQLCKAKKFETFQAAVDFYNNHPSNHPNDPFHRFHTQYHHKYSKAFVQVLEIK